MAKLRQNFNVFGGRISVGNVRETDVSVEGKARAALVKWNYFFFLIEHTTIYDTHVIRRHTFSGMLQTCKAYCC